MCQGAIVSIVKFKKGNRIVRVPISGIGSHSELVSANQKLLKRKGWNDSLPGQEVVSIESDFTKGWNRYTVEAGVPDKSDKGILDREFKKIAGSPKALIAHVKRCGKIDNALVGLLTAPAWEQYDKVKAPALEQYDKVTAPAWEQYKKVKAQALEQYDKVKAPALEQYDKVKAQALEQYDKVTAPAWRKLFAVKSNRVKHLQ